MKKLSNILIILFSIFVLSSPVFAQDDIQDTQAIERYKLPEGQRCTVDGEMYQCFNLEEYKTLLKMDSELKFYEESYNNAQKQIGSLESEIKLLEASLDATIEQKRILQQERDRLYKKWKKENKLRLEAENKPAIGSWIAWGLAAGEAAVILGMVTALLVN